jgi:hypothetical protein
MKYLLYITLLFFLIDKNLPAQDRLELKAGADVVSRYIWRGFDIGSAPSLQPAISGSYKNLSAGLWGAYALSNQSSGMDEIDGWVSYTFHLNDIGVSMLITDYYYPNTGSGLFDYDEPGGAHILEAGLQFTGPNALPLKISGYYNLHNDSGHNTYFEISYLTEIDSGTLDVFAGATGGSEKNPGFYKSRNFGFINIGMGMTKQISLNESFALPLVIRFIINPATEKAHLIAGISL